jgi:aconitate hydratase
MMGVLPIEYLPGEGATSYGLTGTETFDLQVDDGLVPRQRLVLRATKAGGAVVEVPVIARVDTPIEVEYLRHGGILHFVLRQMA